MEALPILETDRVAIPGRREAALPAHPDQAVALRQRWICDPLVADDESGPLAAVYGIAADSAARQVLGPDVAIEIEVIDETNTRIDVAALLARFRRHGNFGCVALIGVQSNQYPRALDVARPFRAAGICVPMGGFHVSGCLSMLDGRAVDLDACRDMGIAMFAGEAEGRLDMVLRHAATGRLAPVYNFMKDLPGMPVPFLPKRQIVRTLGQSGKSEYGASSVSVIGARRVCRVVAAEALDAMFLVGRYLARNREPTIEGKLGD
jgi:hypothetical protein